MKSHSSIIDLTEVVVSYLVGAMLVFVASSALAQSPNAFGRPTASVPNPGANITAVPGSRPLGGYVDQTRSEVLARNGIVASPNPLATQAGLRILMDGGNAIDAAVATAAALGVVFPSHNGMGGDLFAIVWSARDKKLYALASSGWAPKAWTPQFFASRGFTSVPGSGIHSAVVPAAVSGWDALLRRFGTMNFKEVLEPAATYAEEGFPMHERMSWSASPRLLADPDSVATYLPGGQAPALYSIFRNPDMGRALRLLQEQGRDAFYKGDIAKAIVAKSQAVGGAISKDDLRQYQSEWVEPLTTNYHGYDIYQLPPPNQGFAALELLNILEVCVPFHGFNLATLGPRDPQYWHFLIEAKKLAFSDLHRYNADPKFAPPPLNTLLSKQYAASLCNKINPSVARPAEVKGNIEGGTIALSTGDRWGNMVSIIASNFAAFGSGVTIPPYGFVLANRGSGFTLDVTHPNVVAPRKRPFITIMTAFIMKDGAPIMAYSNSGGATQPQTHAQHIVNMVDLGMNVQATADVARFEHNQLTDVVTLDRNLFLLVGAQLQAMSHTVTQGSGDQVFQGVLFERDPSLDEPRQPPGRRRGAYDDDIRRSRHLEPVNGVYRAGADRRGDGSAAGW